MLVRAARRHGRPFRPQGFNVACEQLYLPWLCPAYVQASTSCRRHITIETGSPNPPLRRRRDSQDSTNSPPRRSLATAVELRPFDNIPFEDLGQLRNPSFHPQLHRSTSAVLTLPPFDPTRILVLKDDNSASLPKFRATKGISGDLNDMLSMLEACLQVGRMERARVIMQRLIRIKALGPEAMVKLHNQYLRASVENIIEHPSDSAAQALHKWFELEIRNKDLPMNAETVVYMLKASLQSPPGSRRDRLVRRYMDMGGLEVLGLMEAEEQAHITSIVQDYNYPAEDLDGKEDVMEFEELNQFASEIDKKAITDSTEIPSVRPVEQKGLGLKSLKQALSLFSKKPPGFDGDSLDSEQRRQRQEQLERDAVSSAIDRWRDENAQLTKMGVDTTLQTKSLGSRMWRWHVALESYLREELVQIELAESKTTKSVRDNDRCAYGPFLRILPPERLAAVTILSTMTSLSALGASKGLPLTNAIMAVGSSIEDESVTEIIRKNHGKVAWDKLKQGQRFGFARILKQSRQEIADSLKNNAKTPSSTESGIKDHIWDPQWSSSIKVKIGAVLMAALIETAKVPVRKCHPETGEEVTQMQPAFSHAYQYKLGKRTGVVLGNPILIEQLQREPVHSLLAKHLPMVAEPEPWSKFNIGGFIVHPAKMMRIKLGDRNQRHYAEAAIEKGDMDLMFKGLNVLGKTSWKINQPVFDTMLDTWNSGAAIANFPPATPDLPVPPEPEPSQDPSVRRLWIQSVKRVENLRSGFHSQRCFQNFQLEIARSLRDETFYFPHNVDFRGRAYPIPPYLNHMGADHCRGLLRFGKGKELGPNGLKWLKIHLANVFGYDKASLSERETFAVDHLKDIRDSATNPLQGNRWWLQAEDPWQCLAACFELKNALDSPDPTKFVSHIPIHQDGTCNGLQHYAALGGDEWGAQQVNLVPGDRPADVYSAVANLVKQSLAHDLAHGNPYAKILEGKITRKVVKQTVMTNVYGVTFVGAKAQVRRQLEAAHPDLPNTASIHPGILSSYVATKIFKALSTMFRGAHDIQHWFGECASRISLTVTTDQIDLIEQKLADSDCSSIEEQLQFKSSVIWTNPLRMPVVQPYRASKVRSITTNLQGVSISDPHQSDPVSKRKQIQGFPPNFVHSLDATHMILSALECDKLGLSFAAVHDSFWTHAADIEAMNGVLRDAFIRIHSEDVIGRLASEFNARYSAGFYLAQIRSNSRYGQRLTQLRKSYSNNAKDAVLKKALKGVPAVKALRIRELLMERRRMRLLNSSDRTEVEEGKRMITPASIFEELAADEDIVASEDMDVLGLGKIPKREVKPQPVEDAEDLDMSNVDDVQNPLPGGTALDAAMSEEIMDHDQSTLPPPKNLFADKVLGKSRQQTKQSQWAWLPFQLPPLPKKGSFDISQLKSSEYFFS